MGYQKAVKENKKQLSGIITTGSQREGPALVIWWQAYPLHVSQNDGISWFRRDL